MRKNQIKARNIKKINVRGVEPIVKYQMWQKFLRLLNFDIVFILCELIFIICFLYSTIILFLYFVNFFFDNLTRQYLPRNDFAVINVFFWLQFFICTYILISISPQIFWQVRLKYWFQCNSGNGCYLLFCILRLYGWVQLFWDQASHFFTNISLASNFIS